jgi:hypothetical protein
MKLDPVTEHMLDWLEKNDYRIDLENHRLIPELTLEAQQRLINYITERVEND